MRHLRLAGFTAAIALLAVGSLASHPRFEVDDLFVASAMHSNIPGFGFVLWAHPDLSGTTRVIHQFGGQALSVAFGRSGYLYATTTGQILKFDPSGALVAEIAALSRISIVFDRDWNFYVSSFEGRLDKYDANDSFVRSFTLPGWAAAIDLAADQCTLFYTAAISGLIARFDVCRDQPLAPFATLPSTGHGLRILPDGRVLAASASAIFLLDQSGNIATSFDAPGTTSWNAVALRSDGSSFWASGYTGGEAIQSILYVFNLNSPVPIFGPVVTPLAGTHPYLYVFQDLAVLGEPRAAAGSGEIPVPTLSQALLLILAAALAGIAFVRLR